MTTFFFLMLDATSYNFHFCIFNRVIKDLDQKYSYSGYLDHSFLQLIPMCSINLKCIIFFPRSQVRAANTRAPTLLLPPSTNLPPLLITKAPLVLLTRARTSRRANPQALRPITNRARPITRARASPRPITDRRARPITNRRARPITKAPLRIARAPARTNPRAKARRPTTRAATRTRSGHAREMIVNIHRRRKRGSEEEREM